MKTLFKEDIKTGNTLQNTLQTTDITVKKNTYITWPNDPRYLPKKNSLQGQFFGQV